jgi:hypothetical protein
MILGGVYARKAGTWVPEHLVTQKQKKMQCHCFTKQGAVCRLPGCKRQGSNGQYCCQFHQGCSPSSSSMGRLLYPVSTGVVARKSTVAARPALRFPTSIGFTPSAAVVPATETPLPQCSCVTGKGIRCSNRVWKEQPNQPYCYSHVNGKCKQDIRWQSAWSAPGGAPAIAYTPYSPATDAPSGNRLPYAIPVLPPPY